MAGAIQRAEQIAKESSDVFMPQQFDNPVNPAAHYETTGARDSPCHGGSRVDAFVAGVAQAAR